LNGPCSQEEEEFDDKKEANKGALASGDPCGAVLWPASLDSCFGMTYHGSIGSQLLHCKIKASHYIMRH